MSLKFTVNPLRTFGQVVALQGSLDTEGAAQLRPELERLVAADSPLIALELSGLTYINSQGLRLLQTTMRTIERAGGAMKLMNPPESIVRVFEIIAMPTLMEKFGSLEELDAFLHEEQIKAKAGGGTTPPPKE
jgi:anti-sigma B factor antagonist